jgi:hypothetical protein
LFRACGLLGTICVAAAAYGAWQSHRDPDLRVERAAIDIGEVPAGVDRTVEYVIHNGEREPVRLVGVQTC